MEKNSELEFSITMVKMDFKDADFQLLLCSDEGEVMGDLKFELYVYVTQ